MLTFRPHGILAVVALTALAQLAVAQDVHVPGDFATIQEGVDAVGFGGTVWVAPGIYHESILIDPTGQLGVSHGQDVMAIRATAPGVIVSWPLGNHAQPGTLTVQGSVQDYNLAALSAADVTLSGLTFDGQDDITSGERSMAVIYRSTSGLIEDCVIYGYRESAASGAQNGVGIEVDQVASFVDINNTSFFNIQKGFVVAKSGSTVNVTGCTFTGRGVTSSIAQNGVQFGGTTTGLDSMGSVTDCTFSGFWYDGGTWTSTGVLLYDSGPNSVIHGNTFIDCQTGVYDTANVFKVTTAITDNHFEQVSPWLTGVVPLGVVVTDGNGKNDFLISGNVFRNHGDAGVWLYTDGATVVNNWFDQNGTVFLENAHDDGVGPLANVWDNNTYSDLAANPLAPAAYLIPGSRGSIDGHPLGGAASEVYGSLNPAGSLVVLSGPPSLGSTFSVGLDNPSGTQAAGAAPLFAISGSAQPNFPGGLLVPGWGMDGVAGELLIDITTPGGLSFFTGTPWGGAGSPSTVNVPIPDSTSLVGLDVYGQGVILDPWTPGFTLGLTEAVRMTLGF